MAPSNTTQDTALSLAGNCVGASYTNADAPTTDSADDPLNTVYGLGVSTFVRQVWFELANTTGRQAFARFTITPDDSSADYACAIYLDDPASYQVPFERAYFDDVYQEAASGAAHVGCALEAGETVWLEVAGNDFAAHGLDGSFSLEWALLDSTFYDTPNGFFDDPTVPQAGYVGTLAGPPDLMPTSAFLPSTGIDCAQFETLSYCKLDNLHFGLFHVAGTWTFDCSDAYSAVADSSYFVWVWEEGGGTPVSYQVGLDYVSVGDSLAGAFSAGYTGGLLRTDGENVWAVFYVTIDGPTIHCTTSGPCPPYSHTSTPQRLAPAVYHWNGSGFDNLGTADPPAECFQWLNSCDAVHYNQAVGTLSAAASSADPGVLHVVWSEAGVSQVAQCPGEICATGCAIKTYTNHVCYATFSSSGEIAAVEVASLSDSNEDPFSCQNNFAGVCFVTNAFGTPTLFHSRPTAFDPQFINASLIVTYDSTIQMYDITGGTATLLQSYDYSSPPFSASNLWSDFGNYCWGTHQNQSSWQGTDTLFFATVLDGPSGPAPLMMVPADGSGSIQPFEIAGTPAGGGFIGDTWVDDENVFYTIHGIDGSLVELPTDCLPGDQADTPSYAISADPSVGPWIYPAIAPTGGGSVSGPGMDFVYDAESDSFYTLGWNGSFGDPDAPDPEPSLWAPLKIPMLREYLVCTIGDCTVPGLHIWQRL